MQKKILQVLTESISKELSKKFKYLKISERIHKAICKRPLKDSFSIKIPKDSQNNCLRSLKKSKGNSRDIPKGIAEGLF